MFDRSTVLERSEQIDRSLAFPQVCDSVLAALRRKQSGPIHAIRTFLPTWNKACRGEGGGQGLGLGWHVMLAGLTGAGKTLLALNLVAEALRAGTNVLYFSLEMTRDELLTRLRPIVTGCEVTQLEPGLYFQPDKAEASDREILGLPGKLFTNDEPIWELKDIREAMAYFAEHEGVSLFVVDYAQLVVPSGADARLFEAMQTVSSQLRFMSRKLGVVTVVLSQLNRVTTRERNTAPTVDGLFGSAMFGFDADQVLVLNYAKSERLPMERLENTELLILKNRHGPQLAIPVQLNTGTLRFTEIEADPQSWSP